MPRFRLRPRFVVPLGVAALVTAALVAGCSNNPYSESETREPIIFRAQVGDLRTLDPVKAYYLDEAAVVDLLYPCFFRYHYLKRDPFVLELLLGAEEPKREPYPYTEKENGKEVRKTGEAWTFRIKPGLKFQNDACFGPAGTREITAADFIYSFRRMADPTTGCPVLGFFEDKILGFHDYVEHNRALRKAGKPSDYAFTVQGLEVVDPHTFRILLNQPYPQLRYLMTMHFTSPMAHEAVEKYGKELARHPVGSGAYRVQEYTPKRRMILVENENRPEEYYPSEGMPGDKEAGLLADAGRRLPLANKVFISFIKEGLLGWNLFLQGYQDTWSVTQTNYSQVMTRQGELSPEMRSKGVELLKAPSANILYFGFNMEDPTVGGYTPKKRKLRQAISTAVDAQAFIDLFSMGNGIPAHSVIPPGIFGYDDKYRNPYRQYNVQRAKQLLAEAGYPNGIDPDTGEPLVIYYDNAATDASGRQFVSLLQKQIQAIGIRMESRTWRDVVLQDRLDNGQFQFVYQGWYADYPDPENFVFLLYGPNKRPGPNHTNYNNPEYNRLFEKMRALDDGPERAALIRQMREIAAEDCPWVYVNHDEDLVLRYNWYQNVKPHPVAQDTAKYRRVDGPLRAEKQQAWNRPNFFPAFMAALLLFLSSIPAAAAVRRHQQRRLRK